MKCETANEEHESRREQQIHCENSNMEILIKYFINNDGACTRRVCHTQTLKQASDHPSPDFDLSQ